MSNMLAKGQNGPLTVNDVQISVRLSAAADLSALLVTDTGKVRSDADFVFFNQPAGPGVRLQPGPAGQPATLSMTLNAVPADIAQIRAVITLDDAGTTFGQSAPPTAHVSDNAGNLLYEYRIDGLNAESIVIALEVYRRQDSWKVRAVGQGYAGGFAALVTDHGVSVDDAPASAVPAPSQAYVPPPSASTSAGYPPPVAPPTRPPAQPPSPPPVAPQGEVNLTKGRPVSLKKGQKVTLKKDGGVALGRVRMGLGWDPVKSGGFFGNRTPDIDLDASAVLFAGDSIVDVCYYGQLKSKDGSVQHQGDNLTGEGEGDDEVVVVDLQRIPAHVTTVMFIVTSYRGHTFDQLSNAFCRLIDDTRNGGELARYTLAGTGLRYTGMVMAKFFRAGADWKLQAIGEGIQAKHPGEAAPLLRPFTAI